MSQVQRPGIGPLSAAVANNVVRLFHEYTGRGPTQARAVIRDNVITVVMSNTMLKAERTLVASGKEQMVLETRRCFQQTMREDLVAAVETLTERNVIAFMSDNHIDPDMAVEVFILDAAPDTMPAPDDTVDAEEI